MEPKNISGSAAALPVRDTSTKRKLSRKRAKPSRKPFTLSTKRRFSEKKMRPECNYSRMLAAQDDDQEMRDESLKKSAKKSASAPGAQLGADAPQNVDTMLKDELK